MANNPPCLNCSKRCVGCHATCEEYLQFKKQNDEDNKKRKIKQQIDRLRWY